MRTTTFILFCSAAISFSACKNKNKSNSHGSATHKDSSHSCMVVPQRFVGADSTYIQSTTDTSTAGMVYIPGGRFQMGGDNSQASADEYPKHAVTVSAFYMDATEVTNAEFQKFVTATGYITT
ncbi:MAG: formylglycine-generating enzyme family protein, partial [Pedobacter sp.]